jgi:hypothetical protein
MRDASGSRSGSGAAGARSRSVRPGLSRITTRGAGSIWRLSRAPARASACCCHTSTGPASKSFSMPSRRTTQARGSGWCSMARARTGPRPSSGPRHSCRCRCRPIPRNSTRSSWSSGISGPAYRTGSSPMWPNWRRRSRRFYASSGTSPHGSNSSLDSAGGCTDSRIFVHLFRESV